MAGDSTIMEAIQAKAKVSAACLKETLIAETVDFTVQTSLEIFPLVKRENAWLFRPSDLETVHHREKRFNLLMQYIALAFSKNNVGCFEGGQRAMVSALKETDEALVAKFTKLMQVWKSDKAGGSVGAAVVANNNTARPSEVFIPGPVVSKPDNIDPGQSSRDSERTSGTFKRFKLSGPEGLTQKVADLAEVLAKAPILQSTTSSHRLSSDAPSNTKKKKEKKHSQPGQARGDLPVITQQQQPQQPCEANAFGVETRDGVLVGHPPDYPPGLLDWESPEDDEEFEELVSNRRARISAAHAPATTTGSDRTRRSNEAHKAKTLGADEPEPDDDGWICL